MIVNMSGGGAQETPVISVSSGGLITATAGSKSATKQLSTQSAATYTPRTYPQSINSQRYLTGIQTIQGDANLLAENIKRGVSIFGVSGSYTGQKTVSSNAEHRDYDSSMYVTLDQDALHVGWNDAATTIHTLSLYFRASSNAYASVSMGSNNSEEISCAYIVVDRSNNIYASSTKAVDFYSSGSVTELWLSYPATFANVITVDDLVCATVTYS